MIIITLMSISTIIFFDDAPNTHNFGHHSFFLLIPQRTMEVALKNDIAVVASTIILLGSAEI